MARDSPLGCDNKTVPSRRPGKGGRVGKTSKDMQLPGDAPQSATRTSRGREAVIRVTRPSASRSTRALEVDTVGESAGLVDSAR